MVEETIAEKYKEDFGFHSTVVLNTPEYVPLPEKFVNPENITLVHHGIAKRDRNLELMIRTLDLCDGRYTLHFILADHDPGYIQYLKQLSDQLVPGRVWFHDPIPPDKIVHTIAQHDIGFFLLPPVNENYKYALPNKFFDFIMAGLAVCIGPSPSMSKILKKHK